MSDRAPQTQDKYAVRFPNGMRDLLKAEAETSNRSLNAEIIARLEESFHPKVSPGMALVVSVAISLASAVDRMRGHTPKSHESASAILGRALSGQGDWDEVESFARNLQAQIEQMHFYSPPPVDDAPPVFDSSDMEREFAEESQKILRRLMKKHGIEMFTPPNDDSK